LIAAGSHRLAGISLRLASVLRSRQACGSRATFTLSESMKDYLYFSVSLFLLSMLRFLLMPGDLLVVWCLRLGVGGAHEVATACRVEMASLLWRFRDRLVFQLKKRMAKSAHC
jgi:hypothetical protein